MKNDIVLRLTFQRGPKALLVLMLSWPGARLDAGLPPVIQHSASFQHQSVALGQKISFTVNASGDLPLSFQWRLDGVELFGQTNKTLSITNAQPSDEGDYTVAVANALGEVVSGAASHHHDQEQLRR